MHTKLILMNLLLLQLCFTNNLTLKLIYLNKKVYINLYLVIHDNILNEQ